MSPVFRILHLVDEAIAAVAAIAVGATAVITILAVFFRYIMNSALPWPEEVAGYLLVWITFTGGYLAFRSNGHISFGVLVEMLPHAVQKVVVVANDIVLAGLCVFLTVYCYRMIVALGGEPLVASGIPQWIFMLSLMVFAIGGLIHLVVYRFEPADETDS